MYIINIIKRVFHNFSWFCNTKLRYWFQNLAPYFQPITTKRNNLKMFFARLRFPALHVFASYSDWFNWLSASVAIGWKRDFFWPMTIPSKQMQQLCMQERFPLFWFNWKPIMTSNDEMKCHFFLVNVDTSTPVGRTRQEVLSKTCWQGL